MRLAGAVEPHCGAHASNNIVNNTNTNNNNSNSSRNTNANATASVAVAAYATVGSSLGANKKWCRDRRCQCPTGAIAATNALQQQTTLSATHDTNTNAVINARGAAKGNELTVGTAEDADEVDVTLRAITKQRVVSDCQEGAESLIRLKAVGNDKLQKCATKIAKAENVTEEDKEEDDKEKHNNTGEDYMKTERRKENERIESQEQQQRNITTRKVNCEISTINAIENTWAYQQINNNNNDKNQYNQDHNQNNSNYHNTTSDITIQYSHIKPTTTTINNQFRATHNEINEKSAKHTNVNTAATGKTTKTPTTADIINHQSCYRYNLKFSNMAAGNAVATKPHLTHVDSADATTNTNNNNNNNNMLHMDSKRQLVKRFLIPSTATRFCATLLAMLAASFIEMLALGCMRVQQTLMSNYNNNNNNFNKFSHQLAALLHPVTPLPKSATATSVFITAAAATDVPKPSSVVMRRRPVNMRQRAYRYRYNVVATLCLFYAVVTLPIDVRADDDFFGVNTFSQAPEPVTPEFDYASRGTKKFGDKCENTLECGFPGSICDPKKKSCQCTEDLPVTNHIDKCGKEAAVNESCFFNEQCEMKYFQTECRDGRCVCRFDMTPIWGKDGSVECKGRQDKRGPETYIDPAMIGVLVGMALMFIIICVVLRLFSQARWRENRTIFNTPNPRLMNVSLLRDSKLLHGQERRGSRMSVRAPSRQPSMASLRPHSPNPSLGKTGSHSGSNSADSATSVRSMRSNSVAPGHVVVSNTHHERKHSQYQHRRVSPPPPPVPLTITNEQQHQRHLQHMQQQQHQQQPHMPLITHITPNPVAESVTVEIIEPEDK